MKRILTGLCVAPAILISTSPVAAAQFHTLPGVAGSRVGLMVQTDLEYGGDDLATVNFRNGDSQDVKAGQGITVSGGLHFRPGDSTPFDVQALVGYKYATTAASNADINVSRVVLQLIGDYQFPYVDYRPSDSATLRDLIEDYVGHIHHHLGQIRGLLRS
jgi:hypothetical protein